MRRDTAFMLHILFVLMVTTSAARGRGIVLESYTGDRPADAARLLAPVLEELSRRDYDAGDSVARLFEAQSSKAAVTVSGLPADFVDQVDKGFKEWVGGRFTEATKILVPLVEAAKANSGAMAKDTSLREPYSKALIALALAYQRIGDLSAMRSTFEELVRSFPEAQVSRAVYGPDAAKAFEQTRSDLAAKGRGKLTVKCDDTAVVFVNETYRAAGATTIELPPGEYRVVVMVNKQPSRTHRVTVKANSESTVEIDAKLDQAIRTSGYTGLRFTNDADREDHEAPFAQQFAKMVGASAVAVVGIDSVHGRSAVVGSLVSLQTGKEIRRASIPVEPDPSTDKLRSLARFLAGDDPAPGLEVQFSGAVQTTPDGDGGHNDTGETRSSGGGGRWGGWRFLTAGLGLAGLATGVVLVALDGKCPTEPPQGQQCNDFYDTATPGYIALAGGAVFTGLSIYLFATHKSAPVVAPTQGGGGATVGFVMRW